MTTEDLEKRIKNLEDVEAIKQLKAQYCLYCDDNFDADKLTSLFAEDSIWESAAGGQIKGKEDIHAFFASASKMMSFAIHMVMNPIIEVDGDRARGRWLLSQPNTRFEGNQAIWGAASYDNDYIRDNGEWKIKHLKITSIFWTPFDQGWAKQRFL